MKITIYSGLTTDELLRFAASRVDLNELECELSQRLEVATAMLAEEVPDLHPGQMALVQ